ncbi:MAG TPA: hypothetical protein VMV52_04790 [Candidatus Nanopelagicaceae bacterium]|nr:hypothetical protein [Candidatus Nanopelagicaceae bacterium]
MSAFVWLSIPVVSTICAIVFFDLIGRKRPPLDSNSVAEHEKFQAAMKRQNLKKP